MGSRLRVLVFVNQYLPGQNSGGPVRSVSNLVDALGDEFQFLVVTADRDMGMDRPYEGVTPGKWMQVGKALVYYQTKRMERPDAVARLMRRTAHDVVYVNSLFNRPYSMVPRVLLATGVAPRRPMVLAPRGELCPGALAGKARRKKVFLSIVGPMGLYERLLWQATSRVEISSIRNSFPLAKIALASNLGTSSQEIIRSRMKEEGQLRVAFLARVSPKKNLEFAIRLFRGLSGDIAFDIYGPNEDSEYLEKCIKSMRQVPSNVRIGYHGRVDHADVLSVLSGYHVYLFPTLAENFGHSIIEAMQAGCIPVISDQTPWQDLEEKRVGWAIPLDDMKRFRQALATVRDMDQETFDQWSKRAREYGEAHARDPRVVEQNRQLFLRAIELFGSRSESS